MYPVTQLKAILKWIALFGGVFIVSRSLFRRYYYPLITRRFTCSTSIASILYNDKIINTFNNDSGNQCTGTSATFGNIFNDSIFSKHLRSYYSAEAAQKLVSLLSSAFTVYQGYKLLKIINITNYDIQTRSEHEFMLQVSKLPLLTSLQFKNRLIDFISMNIGYVTIDSLIYVFDKNISKNNHFQRQVLPFLFHHLCVIFGGLTILNDKKNMYGSQFWIFTYFKSDTATVWLYVVWYFRNYLNNCQQIKRLLEALKTLLLSLNVVNNNHNAYGYDSETSESNKNENSTLVVMQRLDVLIKELNLDGDKINEEIRAVVKKLEFNIKVSNVFNTSIALMFGVLFFKIRLLTFTKTLPYWIMNNCLRFDSVNSKRNVHLSLLQRIVGTVGVAGILCVEYYFCFPVFRTGLQMLQEFKNKDSNHQLENVNV